MQIMHELNNESDFATISKLASYNYNPSLSFKDGITNLTTDGKMASKLPSISFLIGVQSCFGLIPNVSVLFLLFQRKRRIRALQILNAHLAVISILILCQGMMYLVDDKRHSEGSWCSLIVYVRNCLINLLALTILAISHERVQGLRRQRPEQIHYFKEEKVVKIGIGIWIFALVAALPTFFSASFMQHTHPDGKLHSACAKGPLLGNYTFGVIYEVIRCLIFHVFLCCYLIFELYKIRAKLKYFYFLQPVPSRRLRKVRRVRFIFLNSVIFVVIWFPFGILHSVYTSVRDKDKITHFEGNYSNTTSELSLSQSLEPKSCNHHPTLYYIGICIIYWYIILLPVILYWTHNNVCRTVRRFFRQLPCRRNRPTGGSKYRRESQIKNTGMEYSRDLGVTVARSSSEEQTAVCDPNKGTQGKSLLRGSMIQIIIELVDENEIEDVVSQV